MNTHCLKTQNVNNTEVHTRNNNNNVSLLAAFFCVFKCFCSRPIWSTEPACGFPFCSSLFGMCQNNPTGRCSVNLCFSKGKITVHKSAEQLPRGRQQWPMQRLTAVVCHNHPSSLCCNTEILAFEMIFVQKIGSVFRLHIRIWLCVCVIGPFALLLSPQASCHQQRSGIFHSSRLMPFVCDFFQAGQASLFGKDSPTRIIACRQVLVSIQNSTTLMLVVASY